MSEFTPDAWALPQARRRVAFSANPLVRRSVKMAAAAGMTLTPRATCHPATIKMAAAAGMTLTPSLTRVVQVPYSVEQLLDMESPRRVESFRFDVLEDDMVIGQLAVIGSPRMTNDASRRIKRDVSGVVIPPRPLVDPVSASVLYAEDIDTARHRVRVVHVLGPGGDEYEMPMGVFVFANDPRTERSYGDTIDASLVDLSQVFDQRVITSQTWPAGTNVSSALRELYDDAGLTASVDTSSMTLGAPLTMLSLRDSRQSTAEALCTLAGFLPPYFDNDGAGVCRSAPDVTSTTPTLQYGSQSRAYDGSVVAASSLLVAPNVWVAEATSGSETPIVGVWRLPPEDPHSIESIGYAIPEQVDVQGIDTVTAANEAARAAAVASLRALRHRTWSSPIDSRHDTFDVIGWDDEILMEQSWTAELGPGGTMTHDALVLQS